MRNTKEEDRESEILNSDQLELLRKRPKEEEL